MMRIANSRRPGLSLIEVLVTLFVMAIGIISLMTLFPVGAMQMGQALRDDRSGQTASQADGITRLWWQTQVVEGSGTEPFFVAMDNPGAPLAAKPFPYDNNPSYPVVLDPIGWYSRAAGAREWISPSAEPRLPRRSPSSIINLNPFAIRACSMMDDITFKEDGTPDNISGGSQVVREGAYNWAAVIQRPNNANRFVADFKVLVFHTKGLYGGHIPGTAPANAETIHSIANGQLVSANANTTQILLNVPIANVGIRSSNWVLDGSNAATANFYRVQSITELTATSTILELDTPLKSNVTQLYILRGLADVFDRPQLTNSGYYRQAP